jgi:hypothetical protein
MPLAYSPTFVVNVVAGYVLTVLGALLALAAGVWLVWAGGEWSHAEPPRAFRALTAAAFTMFAVGIVWQLVGYLRLDYTGVW